MNGDDDLQASEATTPARDSQQPFGTFILASKAAYKRFCKSQTKRGSHFGIQEPRNQNKTKLAVSGQLLP